jgi:hypothetical protein
MKAGKTEKLLSQTDELTRYVEYIVSLYKTKPAEKRKYST